MDIPILKLSMLKKYFPYKKGSFVRAVDGVSLEIFRGETLGLVGESGSGKSTVAYTVVGMYEPTNGQILYNDQDISSLYKFRSNEIKGKIRIVFQDPNSSLNPRRTIRQILFTPLKLHKNDRYKGFPASPEALLEEVGLSSIYAYRFSRSLSGGERQLVAIAHAIATNPDLVLLDEPTSALDVSIQAKVINRLMDLQNRYKLSYLFITHDLSLMRNVAHRVAIMYLGKICEIAQTKEFFEKPLHPYTQMLLSSIPVVTDEEEQLKPKKITSRGEIPSPVNIPPGCSFHLRCPFVTDQCKKLDPDMKELEARHYVRCHLYK
ncbi:peptide/nickel transport system ATP-binding protein/oligopeptide transport system ATP-binding protein [Acetomicrobium flavidum]|uniref:Peptide/nickel transport system ATP-binding protein/oligopeptide transport system ATP-binding protein n=1 Tax=Acetomicrobium flavidum TaxID=49896 RepID=A0ABY1JAJ1_9BACT|nr:peptide/nickel transport system ATP-binding protein/oligopeptide transport system ATP-binding protein [Acetomicrobium flavidum]